MTGEAKPVTERRPQRIARTVVTRSGRGIDLNYLW